MNRPRHTQRIYRAGIAILALGSLVPTGLTLFFQVALTSGPFGPRSGVEWMIIVFLCAALALPWIILYGATRGWPLRVLLILTSLIVCVYLVFAAQ